jgi:hypothetical protein
VYKGKNYIRIGNICKGQKTISAPKMSLLYANIARDKKLSYANIASE